MDYKIISGDGHCDLRWLPGDLFVSNAPARWKKQVPRICETAAGPRWFAEGKDLAGMAQGAASGLANMSAPERGRSKHVDRMYDVGFYEGGPHPSTPELRIKDQEIDGVDAEVIYGILGISSLLEDRDLLRVTLEIYNTWAADFCKAYPQRLVALACIPNDEPEIAAGELRRAAKLGLKGADFAVSTAVKPIWHRDWDPPMGRCRRVRHAHLFSHHRFSGQGALGRPNGQGLRDATPGHGDYSVSIGRGGVSCRHRLFRRPRAVPGHEVRPGGMRRQLDSLCFGKNGR